MTHRLATNYAKNYCNRTLIVNVMVENVVTCFLGHSMRVKSYKFKNFKYFLVEISAEFRHASCRLMNASRGCSLYLVSRPRLITQYQQLELNGRGPVVSGRYVHSIQAVVGR